MNSIANYLGDYLNEARQQTGKSGQGHKNPERTAASTTETEQKERHRSLAERIAERIANGPRQGK